uniref:Clathrin adaptor alpha/beta/gamma-adaptin appendage Ig-like subdomain domain-containing protein n=1 Tax=Brassica oleracea var. oleracea TaxID=109376 RepID=A0A0D3B854_BRAOL
MMTRTLLKEAGYSSGNPVDSAASPPATGPAGRQPAPAPAVPAPVPDLLSDLMGLDNAAIVPVDEPTASSGPPLPIVMPASTGQGLQISAQLTRRVGQVFYSMLFENNTQVVVDGFMIQFNKNTFGLATAGPLQIVPLQPGTSASTMLPIVVLQNMPAGPPSSLLQAAVKNNQQPVWTWRSLADSNEVQREFPGITITSVESTIDLLAAFNMFFIAKRKNGNQDVIYLSAKVPRDIRS